MGAAASRGGGPRPGKFFTELSEALLEFCERSFRLSKKRKDGSTLRDHLEVVARETGQVPEELRLPELPDETQYLWGWFVDLSSARSSNGFGPNPLSYTEIDAWSKLTGLAPTPRDVPTLLAIDQIYIAVSTEDIK